MKENLVKSLALMALAMPLAAVAADAASSNTFTSNVSLVSNYLHRGISQSGNKAAVQGGFDYLHSSGFYAGVWGSSISWISDRGLAINAGLEADTYGGFKGTWEDIRYDAGFIRYNYPTGYYVTPRPVNFAKADTSEVYGAIGYKWITAKYYYSLGDTFGVYRAKGTNYIDLSASYPIPDTGIALGAHYGRQTYKGAAAASLVYLGADPSYSDASVSVSENLGGFVFGLTYSRTNASSADGAYYKVLNNSLGAATVVVSLSRTM